jgi:hypothetical protein
MLCKPGGVKVPLVEAAIRFDCFLNGNDQCAPIKELLENDLVRVALSLCVYDPIMPA